MPFLDPGLYDFCTDRQREVLEAINREEGFQAAAKFLGCHLSFPSKVLKDVKRKAAAQGYAPSYNMTNPVPEGYHVRGVSTLYGPDGEVKAQWVKSTADAEAREAACSIRRWLRGMPMRRVAGGSRNGRQRPSPMIWIMAGCSQTPSRRRCSHDSQVPRA